MARPRVGKRSRAHPDVVVRRRSPNQSDRLPVPLSLIVLHDTEGHNRAGVEDLAGLASWFANPGAEVSSHVATDADGTSARFVSDRKKAWHCGLFNSPSLGIEQIGFAKQTKWPWRQLRETARWIAYWSVTHDIPIRKAEVSGGGVVRPGVIRHMDLGVAGGGHVDPGVNYPFRRVLLLARAYKALRLARGD